jgi:hypothetical protein
MNITGLGIDLRFLSHAAFVRLKAHVFVFRSVHVPSISPAWLSVGLRNRVRAVGFILVIALVILIVRLLVWRARGLIIAVGPHNRGLARKSRRFEALGFSFVQ